MTQGLPRNPVDRLMVDAHPPQRPPRGRLDPRDSSHKVVTKVRERGDRAKI